MKKYLSVFAFALLAVVGLTLTSCGGDDDGDLGLGSISINGKSFTLSPVTSRGEFDEDYNKATFCLAVMDGSDVEYYYFTYKTSTLPQANTVISNMNLTLEPWVTYDEVKIGDEFEYVSGKATIVSVNPSEEEIIVKYENLEMSNGDVTFTFNGKADAMFKFSTSSLP